MSDEDIIIRRVVLCECGKIAGHDSICKPARRVAGLDPERDVQRVDDRVEEEMAERNRLGYERDRRKFDSVRRERRAHTTTLTLYREAMDRAARLTTVSAGNPEPTRGGSDPSGPPRQQTVSDDPRWEDHTRIVRKRVLAMLDLLDEVEGTGRAALVAALTGPEKDTILLDEGRGLIAEQVVAELGPEYGSASYIRRLRRDRGLDSRGYPKEQS